MDGGANCAHPTFTQDVMKLVAGAWHSVDIRPGVSKGLQNPTGVRRVATPRAFFWIV
jgi:hypothetical protein